MARIYRTTDRIPVKVDDVTVLISPLTFEQKSEVQEAMMGFANGDVKAATRGVVLSIKYALKGIEGVEDADGKPYELSLENGCLTDEAVSDMLNLHCTEKLAIVCSSLLNGVPTGFKDNDGNPIKGVEFVKKAKPGKKS